MDFDRQETVDFPWTKWVPLMINTFVGGFGNITFTLLVISYIGVSVQFKQTVCNVRVLQKRLHICFYIIRLHQTPGAESTFGVILMSQYFLLSKRSFLQGGEFWLFKERDQVNK